MTARTQVHNLQVATSLYQFIEQQVLPAVGVKSDKFWKGFAGIVTDLGKKHGFDVVGGMEEVKKDLRAIADNIRDGRTSRVP